MSTAQLTFVLADGTRLAAAGPCVLGRAPTRDGFSAVAINDPERVTSKNHLTVRPVGVLCAITDLHSTNGSAVEVSGNWARLEPGEPTHATLPFRLDCGGVVLTVERA